MARRVTGEARKHHHIRLGRQRVDAGSASEQPVPANDVAIGSVLPAHRDGLHQWAQRVHASARAAERYNVRIGRPELERMAGRMLDGHLHHDLIRLGVQHDRSIWVVHVDGVEMIAGLNHQTRRIATFLPLDARVVETDERGFFTKLYKGGDLRGRAYWRATRGRQERAA